MNEPDQLPPSMDDLLRQLALAALPWIMALAGLVAALILIKALTVHLLRTAPPATIRSRALHMIEPGHDQGDDLETLAPWDAEREEALQEAWAELEPYEWPSDRRG